MLRSMPTVLGPDRLWGTDSYYHVQQSMSTRGICLQPRMPPLAQTLPNAFTKLSARLAAIVVFTTSRG